MKNKYFPDEDITMNDLYFICYMIERVARHIKQKNKYVVNAIGKDELYHLLSCASTLHCENLEKVEADCIRDYGLVEGSFDITNVRFRISNAYSDFVGYGRSISKIDCRYTF